MRIIFLLLLFILGYLSGKLYSTTEEDVYEYPYKYPDEKAYYIVWVKYKNQTFRYEVRTYREILNIAIKNNGAIIIYQVANRGKYEI